MKKHLLFTTLLMSALISHGQMTLTNSSQVFSIGTHQNLQQSSEGIDQGSTGQNQNWDFSSFSGTALSNDIASCSVVTDCSSFGNANMVIGTAGSWSTTASYYYATANVISNTGVKAQGVSMHYSDPEDFYRFPFAYGNSYSDNFKCTFTSGVDFIRAGTMTVTADASGTIKLPSGTYTNALRIHQHEEYSDSIPSLQMVMSTYIMDYYSWYVPGLNSYIFATSNLQVNDILTSQLTTYNTAIPSATGVNNISAASMALKLFPNPANATLFITIDKNDVSIKGVKIYDILGRKYDLPTQITGLQSLNINTSSLSNGMYYAQVETPEGMVNEKFEIIK